MNIKRICKNCKFMDKYDNECNRIELCELYDNDKKEKTYIEFHVDDDQGFHLAFKVDPEKFGCNFFEEK